ncbi:hypothetical protein PVAP13_6NG058500 [Panicum virgatum]|uniref:Uncharacterized protein n=1 Tax=Panicum virgatum TaxID=38727 RepID=A0A8T0QUQ5_PANVG|nr:hypothetical protein PVAP13_6NG058500 [Panicum virgatum]
MNRARTNLATPAPVAAPSKGKSAVAQNPRGHYAATNAPSETPYKGKSAAAHAAAVGPHPPTTTPLAATPLRPPPPSSASVGSSRATMMYGFGDDPKGCSVYSSITI